MVIKGVTMEDFSNYKKPSMFIAFPKCNFKCDMECGMQVCQNGALAKSPNIDISAEKIVKKYLNNPITKAVVCGGLEPMDSWSDLLLFVERFREKSQDDICIYTGYEKSEIIDKINILKQHDNVIVKFGRYIPGHEKHYDEILGIWLASNNQYAERIS
jgi:organic radical activating enzyme